MRLSTRFPIIDSMHINRTEMIQVLLAALTEFNQDLAQGNPLPVLEQTSLVPGSGPLDSLGFINLVTLIEGRIEKRFGIALPLATATGTDGGPNPWISVGALADYLTSQLVSARSPH